MSDLTFRGEGEGGTPPPRVFPRFVLPVFAKLNLTLRVTGRRVNGYHDLVSLTNTFDLKKCNKFSVSEVDAAYNLALLKEIMTPSLIAYNLSDSESEDKEIEAGFYYSDTDTMKSFVLDGMGQNGSYEIQINIFDKNDLDLMQSMFIISDDPQVERQIAKTVAIAED